MVVLFSGVAQAAGRTYSAEELAVVDLINSYRVNNGLDPLLVSDTLSDSSWKHSHDMEKYDHVDHTTTGSDWFAPGSLPIDRMLACGFPPGHAWGENIAAGWATAYSVFNAWVQSDPHNKNLLSPKWKVMGVGFLNEPGSSWGTYWTTDFSDFPDGTSHPNGQPIPPDTTPPTVAITAPASGTEVTGTVTVTIDAYDLSGITKVELYANDYFVAADNAAPYAIVWDTTNLNPGTYLLQARAYDTAGNIGVASIGLHTGGGSSGSTTTTTTTSSTTTTTGTSTTTTPTTTTTSTTTTTTLPPRSFPDVPASSPFHQSITALAGMGAVSGFTDGLFHPAALVTRAQFAKIIVLALGKHTTEIEGANDPSFSDVPFTGNAYPFDYVEEAAELKIIEGYSNGRFKPGAAVTRLQLALMLVRAGSDDLVEPPPGYVCPFSDVPVSGRSAVAKALYNSILSGKTSVSFAPYSPATRGEVAKMVYGLTEAMRRQTSD